MSHKLQPKKNLMNPDISKLSLQGYSSPLTKIFNFVPVVCEKCTQAIETKPGKVAEYKLVCGSLFHPDCGDENFKTLRSPDLFTIIGNFNFYSQYPIRNFYGFKDDENFEEEFYEFFFDDVFDIMSENTREIAENQIKPYLVGLVELYRKGCFMGPKSKVLVDNNYYFNSGVSVTNFTMLELLFRYAPKSDLQDFIKMKKDFQFESKQWKSTYGKNSSFTLEQQLEQLLKQRKD